MRTQKEILDRIEARKKHDLMAFEWPCYLDMLTFDNAKPFLKEGTSPADWHQRAEEGVKSAAVDYMEFAWAKANNFRGISSARSVAHYIAWMWLLGHDGTERWEDYEFYGKPYLVEICGLLGIDSSQWDDGVRLNQEP